jgi:hypothetical protein
LLRAFRQQLNCLGNRFRFEEGSKSTDDATKR